MRHFLCVLKHTLIPQKVLNKENGCSKLVSTYSLESRFSLSFFYCKSFLHDQCTCIYYFMLCYLNIKDAFKKYLLSKLLLKTITYHWHATDIFYGKTLYLQWIQNLRTHFFLLKRCMRIAIKCTRLKFCVKCQLHMKSFQHFFFFLSFYLLYYIVLHCFILYYIFWILWD